MVPQEVTVYYYGGCRTLKEGIRICREEMVNGDVHIFGDESITADQLYEADSKKWIGEGYLPDHKYEYGNDTFRICWKLVVK